MRSVDTYVQTYVTKLELNRKLLRLIQRKYLKKISYYIINTVVKYLFDR